MLHPANERLEALVEGALDPAEQAVVESHVRSCPRCQTEIEEWRALFAAFSGLPVYEPAAGFANRVMAGVRIRVPWPARLAAFVSNLLPETTKGWALAAAILALPVLGMGGAFAWLLRQPWATPQGLLFLIETQTFALVQAGWAWLIDRLATSPLAGYATQLVAADIRGLGVVALVFSIMTLVSLWILWKNLIRTPSRKMNYVSYSF